MTPVEAEQIIQVLESRLSVLSQEVKIQIEILAERIRVLKEQLDSFPK